MAATDPLEGSAPAKSTQSLSERKELTAKRPTLQTTRRVVLKRTEETECPCQVLWGRGSPPEGARAGFPHSVPVGPHHAVTRINEVSGL